MKTLLATAALALLSALPVTAASMAERPEAGMATSQAMQVQRRAGDLFQTADLVRRGLMADDIVSVTRIPSSGRPADYSSRNDG